MLPSTHSLPQSSPSPENVVSVTQLAPGVRLTWLNNRRIIELYAANSTRASTDAWADRLMEIIGTWPIGQPMAILLDLSSNKMSLTPYMRERTTQLRTARPELKMVMAMLLGQTLTGRFVQLMVRSKKFESDTMKMAVFVEHDVAITWLNAQIGLSIP